MVDVDDVPQIDAKQAAARVADGAFLLDVREQDEWDAGHAPQAVHLSLGNVALDHKKVLPDDGTPIVAICRGGGRSQAAAIGLRRAGYDVANVEGGMRAWASVGEPVVTDDGSTGTVV